jgi:hypothetical protein
MGRVRRTDRCVQFQLNVIADQPLGVFAVTVQYQTLQWDFVLQRLSSSFPLC